MLQHLVLKAILPFPAGKERIWPSSLTNHNTVGSDGNTILEQAKLKGEVKGMSALVVIIERI